MIKQISTKFLRNWNRLSKKKKKKIQIKSSSEDEAEGSWGHTGSLTGCIEDTVPRATGSPEISKLWHSLTCQNKTGPGERDWRSQQESTATVTPRPDTKEWDSSMGKAVGGCRQTQSGKDGDICLASWIRPINSGSQWSDTARLLPRGSGWP